MQVEGGGESGFQSEINVTPLVDVVLVLLIILMVIVPLTMRGYDVDIPRVTAAPPPTGREHEQVTLEVDLAGCPAASPPGDGGLPTGCRVRIDDREIPVAQLAGRVGEIFGTRPAAERVLFLAADDRLNYEAVMQVVDLARSGVDDLRIGLVTGG